MAPERPRCKPQVFPKSHFPQRRNLSFGFRGFRRLRTATQRAARPLRESVLHLGVCRLRRQIFREMKGKTEEILCGFPSIFLKYFGKDASKMRANRCKAGSKTSPAALSWSSLFGQTVLKLFCFRTTRFVFRRKAGTRRAVSAGLPRSFLQKKALPPK